jgi:hypothetical protein
MSLDLNVEIAGHIASANCKILNKRDHKCQCFWARYFVHSVKGVNSAQFSWRKVSSSLLPFSIRISTKNFVAVLA